MIHVPSGPVMIASGAAGFFGEGYWFHPLTKLCCHPWTKGAVFVSKTTTLQPRVGNMVLGDDFRPKHLFPDCIEFDILKGHAVNSVGLSGPGLQALLDMGQWQARRDPFWISVMSVAGSVDERLAELTSMCELLRSAMPYFKASFGIQLNVSCPNTGHDTATLSLEAERYVEVLSSLGVPIMVKYNVLMPHEVVRRLDEMPAVTAHCATNTLPWGAQPVHLTGGKPIVWQQFFGDDNSPLPQNYGAGGLSGKPLLDLVCTWAGQVRAIGVKKTLHLGGGILSPDDVARVIAAGRPEPYYDVSVMIGSVMFLRPHNVPRIIAAANRQLG